MRAEEKVLKAHCRQVVTEHGEMLKFIVDDETQKLTSQIDMTGDIYAIAKDAIYKAGIKEGMRRILAKINEYSNKQ